MNVDNTKRKLQLIMTQDELERLTFLDFAEQGAQAGLETEVLADVHGLSKYAAARYLRNLIRTTREPFRLVVIHGCNHGHAIKDMLRENELDKRAGAPYRVINNDGRTLFNVSAA